MEKGVLMGNKTSVIPQMDFLLPTLFKKSHRPTNLTGHHNIKANISLVSKGKSGITSEELAAEQGWRVTTAGPCLVELRAIGLARKTEAKRNGKFVYISIESIQ